MLYCIMKTSTPVIRATLTLPKLETRKVWAGLYGGHLDFIVFFSAKPKTNLDGVDYTYPNGVETRTIVAETISMIGDRGKKVPYYCPYDDQNKELVIGDMHLDDFYAYFPDADLTQYTQQTARSKGRPKATEIPEVFEIELTAIFNEHGMLCSINCCAEGRM